VTIRHQGTKEIIKNVKAATLDAVQGFMDAQISNGTVRFYAGTKWAVLTDTDWVVLRVSKDGWDALNKPMAGSISIEGQTMMFEVKP